MPKLILIDSDVISHFIANNDLTLLPEILKPHKCVVLDYVYQEIERILMRKAFLDSMIGKGIDLMKFPQDNSDMKFEFARLQRENNLIGQGERACMAVARYNAGIVASSNFRDIAPYCKENNIYYIGTLDILIIAYEKKILDESQINAFIQTAISTNKAKFPVNEIANYILPSDLCYRWDEL